MWREEQGVAAMQAACEESRAAAERIFILQLLTGQLDSQVSLCALPLRFCTPLSPEAQHSAPCNAGQHASAFRCLSNVLVQLHVSSCEFDTACLQWHVSADACVAHRLLCRHPEISQPACLCRPGSTSRQLRSSGRGSCPHTSRTMGTRRHHSTRSSWQPALMRGS